MIVDTQPQQSTTCVMDAVNSMIDKLHDIIAKNPASDKSHFYMIDDNICWDDIMQTYSKETYMETVNSKRGNVEMFVIFGVPEPHLYAMDDKVCIAGNLQSHENGCYLYGFCVAPHGKQYV